MAGHSSPDDVLTPSLIGHFIGYDSCPRYFRYRTADADLRHERNWWDADSVGVFLSEVGTTFEEQQLRTLAEEATSVVGLASDETDTRVRVRCDVGDAGR